MKCVCKCRARNANQSPQKRNSGTHTYAGRLLPHTHTLTHTHKTNKLNSQEAKKKDEGEKLQAEIVNNIHDVERGRRGRGGSFLCPSVCVCSNPYPWQDITCFNNVVAFPITTTPPLRSEHSCRKWNSVLHFMSTSPEPKMYKKNTHTKRNEKNTYRKKNQPRNKEKGAGATRTHSEQRKKKWNLNKMRSSVCVQLQCVWLLGLLGRRQGGWH